MFLHTFFIAVTLVATAAAQVQFLGVAIAGGDFGCQIDGTCPTGSTQLPLGSNGGGGDGPGQMQHWASLDKPLNMFRLPVSWQFLANNQLGGDLNSGNVAKYDQLVQACLGTGAHCMVDIHNFARWNGGIIGQGGPTDDQFVSLWTQLATKYADQDRMVFELMNEPHDLDINVWAATCQKVVAAIRGAGATSQMILLPGTNFDSAATLVSSGSTAALMNITNPDGTTDNLLLDIHKYLDEDNSGTHETCTTDNIDAFTTVADFLRQTGRKGIVSETGASSDSTVSTTLVLAILRHHSCSWLLHIACSIQRGPKKLFSNHVPQISASQASARRTASSTRTQTSSWAWSAGAPAASTRATSSA